VFGFPPTKENFKRYVDPWFGNLEYFSEYAQFPAFPKEFRFVVDCPKCGYTLIDKSEHEKKTVDELLKKYGVEKTRIEKVQNPKWGVAGNGWNVPFWIKKKVKYWVYTCPECKGQFLKKEFSTQKKQVVRTNPRWVYFFTASRYLTELGWQELWRSFVGWAYPEVMKAKAVLSKFVTPQLLKEISEGLAGKQPKEKQT